MSSTIDYTLAGTRRSELERICVSIDVIIVLDCIQKHTLRNEIVHIKRCVVSERCDMEKSTLVPRDEWVMIPRKRQRAQSIGLLSAVPASDTDVVSIVGALRIPCMTPSLVVLDCWTIHTATSC